MGKVTARVIGADRVSRRFQIVASELGHDTQKAQQEIGDRAELVFAAHALHRTGRLARGIVAHGGATVVVTANARDPKTGFDYVAVTRFGHQVNKIVPKHQPQPGRYLAPIPGVGPRWVKKRAALGFGGRFFASSKGFHPDHDWAEDAIPTIEREAQAVATKLGRQTAGKL